MFREYSIMRFVGIKEGANDSVRRGQEIACGLTELGEENPRFILEGCGRVEQGCRWVERRW